jgi:hypothetical protein
MLRSTRLSKVWARQPRTPAELIQPIIATSIRAPDTIGSFLNVCGWGLFVVTYSIIANWIYEGYVDLWHGTYGLDDDDDD